MNKPGNSREQWCRHEKSKVLGEEERLLRGE
jgi:hypothetical protein